MFGGSSQNDFYDESNLSGTAGTLTIGAGITIQGQSGAISAVESWPIISQGTISADTAGGTISICGPFTNEGTLQVAGGTLNLNNTWTNTGTTIASAGTLNIWGTLNNTGSTLVLDGTTGSFNLANGTIQGGTISGSGGASLVIVGGGTLDGVTCNANLDLQTYGAAVTVLDGLVLNGTAYLGAADGSTPGMLSFGNQYSAAGSLSGTGTVVFGGRQTNGLLDGSGLSGADGTLTIGAGITIRGSQGSIINNSDAQIINQGTISADTANGTINIYGPFTNEGTLEAAGGTLNLNGTVSNSGLVECTGGTLNLMGALIGGTVQGGVVCGSNATLVGVTCNGDLALQGAEPCWVGWS